MRGDKRSASSPDTIPRKSGVSTTQDRPKHPSVHIKTTLSPALGQSVVKEEESKKRRQDQGRHGRKSLVSIGRKVPLKQEMTGITSRHGTIPAHWQGYLQEGCTGTSCCSEKSRPCNTVAKGRRRGRGTSSKGATSAERKKRVQSHH